MNKQVKLQCAETLHDAAKNYLYSHCGYNLWQSLEWESFMKATGNETYWIIAEGKEGKICGLGLVTERRRSLGFSYAYIGRGPLANCEEVFNDILDFAIRENTQYLLFDPPENAGNWMVKPSMRSVKKGIHPPDTLIIDLRSGIEGVFGGFSECARRYSRRAEREGATISRSSKGNEQMFSIFYELLRETAQLKNLPLFPCDFYRSMLNTLDVEIFTASVDGLADSTALIVYHGDTAIYYYGASRRSQKPFSTSYFLQKEIIKRALEKGCIFYDLYGISPEGDSNHYLAGVTEFKSRFGGTRKMFPPATVLVAKPLQFMISQIVRPGLRILPQPSKVTSRR